MNHAERQKLLNRLNLLNETLCDILDKKIDVMMQEKKLRQELDVVNALLAEEEPDLK